MNSRYELFVESEESVLALSDVESGGIKPKNFSTGEQFETFVEEKLFPETEYVLIKRADTYERNAKRFSESSNGPDFIFRCKITNQVFAVEAKYRSTLNDRGELSWCKLYQKARYDAIDSIEMPVFIAVGLGGQSYNPEKLFLFPVREIKYVNLFMIIAEKYELDPFQRNGVKHEFLWKLLRKQSH